MKYDATSLGGKFKIPILLLQGDTDLQSPAPLVKEYLSIIKAPDKEMVLLQGEGHTAVLTLPDVFLKELITRIRPLAK
jgi:pimeloyl-ACP methyl ester carboxylesterase